MTEPRPAFSATPPSTASDPASYQIDLLDNGEPGTNDKYRIFIPGVAYESGLQTLRGGNVQIR